MSTLTASPAPAPLTLKLRPIVEIDDDQLYELCRGNEGLAIERSASGELVLMTPAGGRTSLRNAKLTTQLCLWARRDETGQAFDSSGGFVLPNGAMRSPAGAWVERERLQRLSPDQLERFLPLSPTFVVELRSPSDSLALIERKMEEYMANGARLGWVIDPVDRRVLVYRPGHVVQTLPSPTTVAGEPELPGFVLELEEIWDPTR